MYTFAFYNLFLGIRKANQTKVWNHKLSLNIFSSIYIIKNIIWNNMNRKFLFITILIVIILCSFKKKLFFYEINFFVHCVSPQFILFCRSSSNCLYIEISVQSSISLYLKLIYDSYDSRSVTITSFETVQYTFFEFY